MYFPTGKSRGCHRPWRGGSSTKAHAGVSLGDWGAEMDVVALMNGRSVAEFDTVAAQGACSGHTGQ